MSRANLSFQIHFHNHSGPPQVFYYSRSSIDKYTALFSGSDLVEKHEADELMMKPYESGSFMDNIYTWKLLNADFSHAEMVVQQVRQ